MNKVQILKLQSLHEGVLITPNVDHLVKLQKDKEFYEVYQQAEWVVCDSKILYLLSKLLKQRMTRIAEYFCWEPKRELHKKRWSVSMRKLAGGL